MLSGGKGESIKLPEEVYHIIMLSYPSNWRNSHATNTTH
jgi:hypothetical protein